jgi:hypothetical protein
VGLRKKDEPQAHDMTAINNSMATIGGLRRIRREAVWKLFGV